MSKRLKVNSNLKIGDIIWFKCVKIYTMTRNRCPRIGIGIITKIERENEERLQVELKIINDIKTQPDYSKTTWVLHEDDLYKSLSEQEAFFYSI